MFSKDQTAGRVVCMVDYGRLKAGAIVPESNELYADVEAWLAEGNPLGAFGGYPVMPQEPDDVRQRLTGVIQAHLDATAQQRNYDGILSLCSYATSSHAQFAAEGQAGVKWRDAVWKLGYQLLDEVKSGEREIPTDDELIAMLPPMEWPAA